MTVAPPIRIQRAELEKLVAPFLDEGHETIYVTVNVTRLYIGSEPAKRIRGSDLPPEVLTYARADILQDRDAVYTSMVEDINERLITPWGE